MPVEIETPGKIFTEHLQNGWLGLPPVRSQAVSRRLMLELSRVACPLSLEARDDWDLSVDPAL